jgi:hypothetical protein
MWLMALGWEQGWETPLLGPPAERQATWPGCLSFLWLDKEIKEQQNGRNPDSWVTWLGSDLLDQPRKGEK